MKLESVEKGRPIIRDVADGPLLVYHIGQLKSVVSTRLAIEGALPKNGELVPAVGEQADHQNGSGGGDQVVWDRESDCHIEECPDDGHDHIAGQEHNSVDSGLA